MRRKPSGLAQVHGSRGPHARMHSHVARQEKDIMHGSYLRSGQLVKGKLVSVL